MPRAFDDARFYLGSDLIHECGTGPQPKPPLERDESNIFQITIETTAPGDVFTLYLSGCGAGNVLDWGDGSTETLSAGVAGLATGAVSANATARTHTYAMPGRYQVTYEGTFTNLGSSSQNAVTFGRFLVSVDRWGEGCGTLDAYSAFCDAVRLVDMGVLLPRSVAKVGSMFQGASAFNGDLSGWDTSAVKHMAFMFQNAVSFNGDLSRWDTSAVTDMSRMFQGANAFNGDISGWDTSAVKNMTYMLYDAYAFNGDLSRWDTSAVTNMSRMFQNAYSFNCDLSTWNVSAVTNMSGFNLNANASWVANAALQPQWPVATLMATAQMEAAMTRDADAPVAT